MLPVKKIRILMQKDYKQRKKLHIKKRQGVPYTAFSINEVNSDSPNLV